MMSSKSDIAVSVRGLSKSYTIAHDQEKHNTLAETMLARVKNPLRRPKKETFWALKDINFDIKKGDVVGIIGRNGAGKSTLLKILSRITEPTTGQIDLYGRVGSLLEVGTGFHPELTGRENIFLNGAILGMNKAEIRKQFDAIVDFSGVEKFLDTPVKRYSSGMYVRLAFAVAAHLPNEILVLDEVLAVGDVTFQEKCLSKVGDVASEGRTILMVSHNMGVIRTTCETAIMLQEGSVGYSGDIDQAVAAYNNFSTSRALSGVWRNPAPRRNDEAVIEFVEIVDAHGKAFETISSSCHVYIRMQIDVREPSPLLKIGFDLVRSGITVFRTAQVDSPVRVGNLGVGKHILTCEIPADLLFMGTYFVRPQMSLHFVKWLQPAGDAELKFDVEFDPRDSPFLNILDERNHPGVIFPQLHWTSIATELSELMETV